MLEASAKGISAEEKNRLLVSARDAGKLAYCPYSNFRVGAAALAGGRVFIGCNVENASHSLSICAERTAIFNAVAAGYRRIDAIAVVCLDMIDGCTPTPCGACRQVIAQFGAGNTIVIVD